MHCFGAENDMYKHHCAIPSCDSQACPFPTHLHQPHMERRKAKTSREVDLVPKATKQGFQVQQQPVKRDSTPATSSTRLAKKQKKHGASDVPQIPTIDTTESAAHFIDLEHEAANVYAISGLDEIRDVTL